MNPGVGKDLIVQDTVCRSTGTVHSAVRALCDHAWPQQPRRGVSRRRHHWRRASSSWPSPTVSRSYIERCLVVGRSSCPYQHRGTALRRSRCGVSTMLLGANYLDYGILPVANPRSARHAGDRGRRRYHRHGGHPVYLSRSDHSSRSSPPTMQPVLDFVIGHFNTFTYIVLMMIGFYAMTGKVQSRQETGGDEHLSVVHHPVHRLVRRPNAGATIPIVEGRWPRCPPADRAGARRVAIRQPFTPRPDAHRYRRGGRPSPAWRWPSCFASTARYGTLEEDELLDQDCGTAAR